MGFLPNESCWKRGVLLIAHLTSETTRSILKIETAHHNLGQLIRRNINIGNFVTTGHVADQIKSKIFKIIGDLLYILYLTLDGMDLPWLSYNFLSYLGGIKRIEVLFSFYC